MKIASFLFGKYVKFKEMEKITIINNLPVKRWKEYRDLQIEAHKESPLAFSETLSELRKTSLKDWQKDLKDSLKNKTVIFFALDGEKLIGMVDFHIHRLSKLKHNAFLGGLYVRKEYRGKGIGKSLTQKIIDVARAKKAKNIFSEIIETQTASIELHKKLGFKIVGKLENFLKDGNKYHSEFFLQKKL